VFEAKLAMRLQSGEPKCANCKWWDREPEAGVFGRCNRLMADRFTTDLSVCSKWEMPDGQQAKVETPSE
jgi:hypothetical protein